MVPAGMTSHGSRIPRGTRLASVVRGPLTARPAPEYLLGGSTPDFGGKIGKIREIRKIGKIMEIRDIREIMEIMEIRTI